MSSDVQNLRRQAAADLWWLAEHADDLAEARFRGTPRPWRQVDEDATTAEQHRQRDALERAERTGMAIGEHPAPLHLDVLDVMVELLATADDLAERVAQCVGADRLPPASSSMASSEPYLRLAAAHLRAVSDTDPGLLDYIAEHAARLRSQVTSSLALLATGQRLSAACPWCHTDRALVVREGRDGEALVVCESDVCEPGDGNVALWHGTRPAWTVRWWPWLAEMIDYREAS